MSAEPHKPLIPTTRKPRLPRFLSHPIGAQAISDALWGAPHYESLTLSFSHDIPLVGFQPRKGQPQLRSHCVMRAEFQPRQIQGYYFTCSENWSLWVYPVVREQRHLANRLILERGLPFLRQWLRSSEKVGWLTRRHEIELVFNPVEEAIVSQEHVSA